MTALIEINSNVLKEKLKTSGLSRQELADQLDVSTKTLQRWLNESVRRVSLDTLDKLAKALNSSSEELQKSLIPVELRPVNRTLEEICSENFIIRIRAHDDYESYLKLLKTFRPEELNSEQRMILFLQIGVSSFFLEKTKAGRFYFAEALKLAYALKDTSKIISILSWQALLEDFSGEKIRAHTLITEAETYLPLQEHSLQAESELLFRKSQVLYHSERVAEAVPVLRKSILLNYERTVPMNIFFQAIRYYHLSEFYLHLRDWRNARIVYNRALRMSEKAGWVRGRSYSSYGLALILLFQNAHDQEVGLAFRKARQLNAYTATKKINIKAEQREFLYFAAKEQWADARRMVQYNIKMTRRFTHFISYAILDGLFLEKLAPHEFTIRRSLVERAMKYFIKNNLHKSLSTLDALLRRDRISYQELLELYIF